jgi:ATP/maltotriose-dependent transcriptional regulator MalT
MARTRRPPSAKLARPTLREPTLHRPRFYAKLEDALRRRLTLITGDAGFGKSTLAAGYFAGSPRPALWYRIDEADNDPGVFVAALREGARAFRAPTSVPIGEALPRCRQRLDGRRSGGRRRDGRRDR